MVRPIRYERRLRYDIVSGIILSKLCVFGTHTVRVRYSKPYCNYNNLVFGARLRSTTLKMRISTHCILHRRGALNQHLFCILLMRILRKKRSERLERGDDWECEHFDLAKFSRHESKKLFRFRKGDLEILRICLRIPNEVVTAGQPRPRYLIGGSVYYFASPRVSQSVDRFAKNFRTIPRSSESCVL